MRGSKRTWTREQVAVIEELYADLPTAVVAEFVGREPRLVAMKAASMGLRKSEGYLMNGIAAILADRERTDAPRVCTRPAPRRELLLWWLGRRSLSARELAERTGLDIALVKVLVAQMRRDRQILVAYRKSVEYAIDGSGRKRHVVNCYRARVR